MASASAPLPSAAGVEEMPSAVSSSTVLTLLGFCASVLFILFVCSRLACALVRRRRPSPLPRSAVRGATSSGAVLLARRDQDLDLDAVAAFPTRAFSAGGEADDDFALCAICLAVYEDKDMLRILPHCGHNFHLACIDIWLKKRSTCPVCRVSLRHYPGSRHTIPDAQSADVAIPPCSPERPSLDPWHCLFAATVHAPRMSEVLRNEPGQVQISVEGGNNLPSSG